MDLKHYFTEKSGRGILSTSSAAGVVNSAIYATPHFLEDGVLTFIMRDRLTHANLSSNTNANYMFIENGPGVAGLRINMEKVAESEDQERIDGLSRRKRSRTKGEGKRFLVSFKVKKILPLLGDGTTA